MGNHLILCIVILETGFLDLKFLTTFFSNLEIHDVDVCVSGSNWFVYEVDILGEVGDWRLAIDFQAEQALCIDKQRLAYTRRIESLFFLSCALYPTVNAGLMLDFFLFVFLTLLEDFSLEHS